MIPQILHRIWWGSPMPAEFAANGDAWRRLNPAWTLTDWTSLDAFGPLANQALYDAAPARDPHRYRADVARLEILHRYGGVYVDCDMEPLRPIAAILAGRSCVVAESPNVGPHGVRLMSNAFMAAEPGHPFLAAAIAGLSASAAKYADRFTAKAVGAWHLHRVFQAQRFPGVTVLPSWTVYPQSIRERDRGETPDLSRAYAWHRWATSRDRVRRSA